MKKKILFLVNHDIVIYNFRKELVKELIDSNYAVYISSPNGPTIKLLENIGATFIETKIDRHGINPFADILLIKKYLKFINEIKPDVILSFTIKPNIYGGIAARITKTPYISNITGLGTAVEKKGILSFVTTTLYRFALKNANCIFFQNSENMNYMASKNINGKSKVLLPGSGVNIDDYPLLEYPNEKGIHFLFVARVMKAKGIDYYLEAAKIIKSRHPNIVFHVLGDCEENYRKKLENYEKMGYILYHGRQNDMIKYYKLSHCTIHPSYYPEGISNVLLESASCGRPIITTKRSGCQEAVDQGITGYLIDCKNLDQLVDAIEHFLSLSLAEKKRMGYLGRLKMERSFNRRIVTEEYMRFILNITRNIN
ncbi:MAG: glycosyltransferase family 4 protein [Acholeplasmataceae bacterium]|nr:glycosyltransferase family 4 protein [Acholeplasmataceae bacterium]